MGTVQTEKYFWKLNQKDLFSCQIWISNQMQMCISFGSISFLCFWTQVGSTYLMISKYFTPQNSLVFEREQPPVTPIWLEGFPIVKLCFSQLPTNAAERTIVFMFFKRFSVHLWEVYEPLDYILLPNFQSSSHRDILPQVVWWLSVFLYSYFSYNLSMTYYTRMHPSVS